MGAVDVSLTGKWINGYGSLMTLFQSQQGSVVGEYVSTTGSSGKYSVLGWAGLADPRAHAGQPAALSIYWRSTAGGREDPSWHWVSGMAGQLLPPQARGEPKLLLMHAMVATDPFPGVAKIGTYIDKLDFTPHLSSLHRAACVATSQELPTHTAHSIAGSWVCDRIGAQLTLAFDPQLSSSPGALKGALSLPTGADNPLSGFTDIYAQPRGVTLQGVSVTSLDLESGNCRSLAGTFDTSSNLMTLGVYTANATAPDAAYVQTTVDVWTFRKLY